MTLRQFIDTYIQRCTDILDDTYVVIESRDTADHRSSLAELLGLLETLKSESLHDDAAEG